MKLLHFARNEIVRDTLNPLPYVDGLNYFLFIEAKTSLPKAIHSVRLRLS